MAPLKAPFGTEEITMKRFKIGMGVLGACTALSFGAFAQTAQDPVTNDTANDTNTTTPGMHQPPNTDTYGQRPENKARVPEMKEQKPQVTGANIGQQPAAPVLAIDPREVQQVFGQQATVVDLKKLSADDAKRLQQHLKDIGYYKGEVDGIIGPQTRGALNTLVRNQFALTQSLVQQGQMPSTLAQSIGINGDVMPASGTTEPDVAPPNNWNNNPTNGAQPHGTQPNGTRNVAPPNNNQRQNPSGNAPNVPPPTDYPKSPPATNQTGSGR
jgi:hypothetical protein